MTLPAEHPGDGAAILRSVDEHLTRFVAYPSPHARTAHTLWIAHTHFMDKWDNTPRIAFLSAEPGSGKSRALEVTEPMVPKPILSVSTTPAFMFRRISELGDIPPTILFDEIDTIYGPKAAGNEELRALLNSGYRRGAVAGRCVIRGKEIHTEELSSYCAVAMAGLGNLPDTVMTRSIIIRMRRRKPDEMVEPYRQRINVPEGKVLGARLEAWANRVRSKIRFIDEFPPTIKDRDADIWEALLSVADVAGGQWPDLARSAAVALVAEAKDGSAMSLGVMLLRDTRTVFKSDQQLSTCSLIDRLLDLEESPWADLGDRELDSRKLSSLLKPYGIRPVTLRIGNTTPKGYRRQDFADAWARYLPPILQNSATTATTDTAQQEPAQTLHGSFVLAGLIQSTGVADVADVADFSGNAARCQRCDGEGCRYCQVVSASNRF